MALAGLVAGVAALPLCLALPVTASTVRATSKGSQAPFGLRCHRTEGVRYCPGELSDRVPSFDGTPLDVNVVLPLSRPRHGFPLVVELHGWAGQKLGLNDNAGGFEDPSGGQYGFLPTPRNLAAAGMAVLTYSSRGFGNSCGTPRSRAAAHCARGWTHLADVRYEVRDSQYLAGVLADEGIVDPRRIGVIGSSYGGLQALEMATLGDRSVRLNGRYVPWVSPRRHLRMHLAAVSALDTAASLLDALVPNGRFLDHGPRSHADDLNPVGVTKASWNLGLYGAGQAAGYIAPPGVDRSGDLTTEFARLAAGDPYTDPVARASLRQVARYHEAFHLRTGALPPPTLLVYGWTDSLFPVDQGLRWLAMEHQAHGERLRTAELFTDVGHPPAPNKPADRARVVHDVTAWMRRYLAGRNYVRTLTGYQAWLHTCPNGAPSTGPYSARSWPALHPRTARFAAAGGTVNSYGTGDAATAQTVDPVLGHGICTTVRLHRDTGTILRRFPVPRAGLTLLGSPQVRGRLGVSGSVASAFLAARLWDEAPGGDANLVTRLLYRPTPRGPQTFQLHPCGYRFPPGHHIVLQLLGADAPYARPANLPFTLSVRRLRLTLPLAGDPSSS